MTKVKRLLGCVFITLMLSLSVFAGGALAASPQPVTIYAAEFFPASGDAQITIQAQGGVFGASSSGQGTSLQETLGSDTSLAHRAAVEYHGVDAYTTSAGDALGTLTFKWQFTCIYTSDIHSVCSGPWHITAGSGDYQGAMGGGTAVDQCDDEYNGADGDYSGTRCTDTLNGKIQMP
jgi:hypothetical protein